MRDSFADHGEATCPWAAILGGTSKQVNETQAGCSDWQLLKLDRADRSRVDSEEDLDAEVRRWIRTSYAVGEQKHLRVHEEVCGLE